MSAQQITIRRPDDWHVHLRDGRTLRDVVPFTARHFARAIVMPNLVPPVVSTEDAIGYRERIIDAIGDRSFEPLMTVYLTDNSDPQDIVSGYRAGALVAAKLYPAGATTNADAGVTDIRHITPTLEAMASVGMPLLIHGEVVGDQYDVFDREARFIEEVLEPLCRQHPELPIVLEHITTREAVDFILAAGERVAATITPHHLMINRTAMFRGGLRPHFYCLPVAKREHHRLAVRAAATSGNSKFFLGTDSAPHARAAKESACGCAGIFNAPTALACYAQVFDEDDALDELEAFAALNGPRFYGRQPNAGHVTLARAPASEREPSVVGSEHIQVFYPDTPLNWAVVEVE